MLIKLHQKWFLKKYGIVEIVLELPDCEEL